MAIPSNDNYDVRAAKLADRRAGPWADIAAAKAGVPESYRQIGLTVVIGLTDGIDYHWKDGVTDDDLVVKVPKATTSQASSGTNDTGLMTPQKTATFAANNLGLQSTDSRMLPDGRMLSWYAYDENGNVSHAVSDKGKLLFKEENVPAPTFFGEDLLVICYGESTAVGYSATPPLSTAPNQLYDLLMFDEGELRPYYTEIPEADWFTGYKPLVEYSQPVQGGAFTAGETPLTGTMETIKQMLQRDHSFDPLDNAVRYIGSVAAARGGYKLEDLVQGTDPYGVLLDSVTGGLSISNAADRTFNVPFVIFMCGHNDGAAGRDADTWKTTYLDYVADQATDIMAITGQANRPVSILSQYTTHDVGEQAFLICCKQLEAALENDDVVMSCTTYPFDYADIAHFANVASKHIGCYHGLAAYRAAFRSQQTALGLNIPKWLPLHCTGATVQGRVALLNFHIPHPPLVLDIATVVDPGDYGFKLYNSIGALQTITSVELVNNDIKITAASNIFPGSYVRYGFNARTTGIAGRLTGARGNLRDSQGLYYIGAPGESNFNLPLHNWLPFCQITL